MPSKSEGLHVSQPHTSPGVSHPLPQVFSHRRLVPTKPANGPVLMLCLWISSAGPPGENCFLPCRGACQLSPPRHPEISQVVLQGLGKPWGGLRQLSPVLPLPPFAAVVLRAPRSPARSEATSGHRVGSCPHPVQGAGERRHFPPASGSPAPSFPVPSPYPPPTPPDPPTGPWNLRLVWLWPLLPTWVREPGACQVPASLLSHTWKSTGDTPAGDNLCNMGRPTPSLAA